MSDQKPRIARVQMNPLPAVNQHQTILKKLASNINNGGNSQVRASSLPISVQNKRAKLDDVSKYAKTFQEIKKIGQGNYSIVFKCKNVVDNCIYAVKKTQAQFKTFIEKSEARQEACILADLFSKSNNCNIVQYYNSWIEQNQFYLVMEYCDYNLKHQLAYQEWEIKYILRQVLNGLAYLHSNSLVHMDIKPENILFKKKDLCYKISDFGLARSKIMKEGEDLQDGDCRYGAPEIIEYMNYSIPIDLIKVDIFALGCTIFELMNQIELPKQDEEYHELRKGIRKSHFRDVGISYSDELINLVLQMMSPDPKNRPTTIQLINSKYLAIPMMNEGRFLEMSNDLMLKKLTSKSNCNLLKKKKSQSQHLLPKLNAAGSQDANSMEIEGVAPKNFEIDQSAIDFNRITYNRTKQNKEFSRYSRIKSI